MNFRCIFSLVICFVSSGNGNSLQEKYDACLCNDSLIMKYHEVNVYKSRTKQDRQEEYWCCAKYMLVNTPYQDFNITWSLPPQSTFEVEDHECFGQKIVSKKVLPQDEGSLTCKITSGNKTFIRINNLQVEKTETYSGAPIGVTSPATIFANHGDNKSIKCSFHIPNNGTYEAVYWRKVFFNEEEYRESMMTDLGVEEVKPIKFISKQSLGKVDRYETELKLRNISDAHFGNYSCQIKMKNGRVTTTNTSVVNEVHPEKNLERTMMTVTVIAAASAFILLVLIWLAYRLRLDIILMYRHKKGHYSNQIFSSKFEHDIFIIHGPSTTTWVYENLLTFLEDQWSYRCFLPDRNILAGEETVEAISRNIEQSRRIIIVTSECLLESKWCAFMMFQAIHNVLASSSKILATTLTDISKMEGPTLEMRNMLQILKCIKKIKYPLEFQPLRLPEVFEQNGEFEKNSKFQSILPEVLIRPPSKEKLFLGSNLPNSNCQCLTVSKSSPNFVIEDGEMTLQTDDNHPMQRSYSIDVHVKPKSLNLSLGNKTTGNFNFNVRSLKGHYKRSSGHIVNPFLENSLQKLKDDLRTHPYQEINSAPFIMKNDGHEGKKRLCSESSGETTSPCSDTPFFGKEFKQNDSKQSLISRLNQRIFGNSEDKFWKQLRIHLPAVPLNDIKRTSYQEDLKRIEA